MKDEVAKKKGLPFSTSRSQEKAYKKNTKKARRQADKKACADH
jgi:antitoxin component of RelBE/YafQ-DinJ toxin-antitoxin module